MDAIPTASTRRISKTAAFAVGLFFLDFFFEGTFFAR